MELVLFLQVGTMTKKYHSQRLPNFLRSVTSVTDVITHVRLTSQKKHSNVALQISYSVIYIALIMFYGEKIIRKTNETRNQFIVYKYKNIGTKFITVYKHWPNFCIYCLYSQPNISIRYCSAPLFSLIARRSSEILRNDVVIFESFSLLNVRRIVSDV